jgi:hypothetical protein
MSLSPAPKFFFAAMTCLCLGFVEAASDPVVFEDKFDAEPKANAPSAKPFWPRAPWQPDSCPRL